MKAIKLEINTGTKDLAEWQDVYLSDDLSFSVEENSPIFSENNVFSEQIDMPIEPNLHILGNSIDITGESIYKALYGRPFRLWVCGVLFKQGQVILDSEVDVNPEEGVVTFELRASQKKTFEELLNDVNAQDVEIYEGVDEEDKVQIGFALPNEGWKVSMKGKVWRYYPDQSSLTRDKALVFPATIFLPKVMLPKYFDRNGALLGDFVNTDKPYPFAKFCNARVCSQTYNKGSNGWEQLRSMTVGEPERVNSAPCFYVMFWIDRLFELLGVHIERNDMNNYADLRRLAFMRTNCDYKTEPTTDSQGGGSFLFGQCDVQNGAAVGIGFDCGKWQVATNRGYASGGGVIVYPEDGDESFGFDPAYSAHGYHTFDVYSLSWENSKGVKYDFNGAPGDYPFTTDNTLCKAFATSKNFPDMEAKELIEALENAFCLRFVYDADRHALSIFSVREILRHTDTLTLQCSISEVYKKENHVRGFRLKYSAANEIKKNAITKLKERTQGGDETTYNYNDFRYVEIMDNYNDIVKRVSLYDETLFLDPNTGNAYRIKVDKDAKESTEKLYPSLFEVWGYHDVEYGDCEDDDFVEEVSIGFKPAIESETNYDSERREFKGGGGSVPAIFCDAEIHTRADGASFEDGDACRMPVCVAQVNSYAGAASSKKEVNLKYVDVNILVNVRTPQNWTQDGTSEHPYDKCDFGFTLGILRDNSVEGALSVFNDNYDGEGNAEWMFRSSSRGDFTSDSVDVFGNPLCRHTINSTTIVRKEDVAAFMEKHFKDCNANLLSPYRSVSPAAMAAAGFRQVDGGRKYAIYPYFFWVEVDGKQQVLLLTPIQNNGNVVHAKDVSAYVNTFRSGMTREQIFAADKSSNGGKDLLLGLYEDYDAASTYLYILQSLDRVCSGDTDSCQVAVPGTTKIDNGLSLKLQATKPGMKDFKVNASVAKRGIADYFYSEYAHFIINRKVAVIVIERGGIELADLLDIDWTRKYTIGQYSGWLSKVTTSFDMEGLAQVTIELYYL